jgi:hypothetical protein
MPNAKNLPTDYDEYVGLAGLTKKDYALPLLNRFAFRYRLAESFQGMVAPEVGRTLEGYNALTKVFLAYTAYEAIIKAARTLRVHSVNSHELNMVYDKDLAVRLRKNEKLKAYLESVNRNDVALTNKHKLFFDGTTSDIVCIAYSLRNIFAHGDLTASAVGTETIAKRKVFIDLANSLLDYCDDTFTLCLKRL